MAEPIRSLPDLIYAHPNDEDAYVVVGSYGNGEPVRLTAPMSRPLAEFMEESVRAMLNAAEKMDMDPLLLASRFGAGNIRHLFDMLEEAAESLMGLAELECLSAERRRELIAQATGIRAVLKQHAGPPNADEHTLADAPASAPRTEERKAAA